MTTHIKSRKNFVITPDVFLAVYFLLLFIHTLHIGSNKLLLFGYIGSVFTAVIYLVNKQRIHKTALLIPLFCCLTFYLYLQPTLGYSISQLKYWIYLFPLVVIPYICNSHDFNKVFCKVCILTLVVSIFLFFVGIGVDKGYGFPRMHGLLSEPSALSIPISIVALNGIFYKKLWYVALSFFTMLLAGSLMVIIITFAACLMYLFIRRTLLSRMLLSGLFVIFIWALYSLISYLAQLGTYPSISRLHQGLIFIESFGVSGHNPRFYSVLEIISYIKKTNFLFGGGINAAEQYVQQTGNLRDLNLWLEIVVSFGVVGVFTFILLLLVFVFFTPRVFSRSESILLSTIVVYCFLNSAQGIVFQSLFFIILIQVLKKEKPKCLRN